MGVGACTSKANFLTTPNPVVACNKGGGRNMINDEPISLSFYKQRTVGVYLVSVVDGVR